MSVGWIGLGWVGGGACRTWVLCWTDSGTMGEMASSRSVGMIGFVELLFFWRCVSKI